MPIPIKIENANVTGEGGNITGATITGDATLQPLSMWGGANEPFPTPPIAEPPWGFGGRPPTGIWGPGDPRPTPPIAEPPGGWGSRPEPPLLIWGPNDPRPTPPIYWAGYPEWPPTEPSPEPPPTDKWTWRYDEELGWVLVPPQGGKPSPPPTGRRR